MRFHAILRIRELVRTLVKMVRRTAALVVVLTVLVVAVVVGKNALLNEDRKGIRKTRVRASDGRLFPAGPGHRGPPLARRAAGRPSMSVSQRYSVARTIGRLMHLGEEAAQRTTMLIGPGRWGTSMPWLGVPVSFAEISKASVVCELAVMHQGLVTEVSLGTHFFNDLVEMDILYLAVIPGKEHHCMNEQFLRQRHNELTRLLPSAREWTAALWVIDSHAGRDDRALFLNVDSMQQRAVCYAGKNAGHEPQP